MTKLVPMEGRVLVVLEGQYKNIAVTEKKFDSKTTGTVVGMSEIDHDNPNLAILMGKKVYWRQYQEGETMEEKYAFIKIEDIDGYSDEVAV